MVKKSDSKKPEAIDLEAYKTELKSFVNERIDEVLIDKIESVNKKLLREKSRKIWSRNIVILILLGLSIFLTSTLYYEGYFNRFFTKTEQISSAEQTSEKQTENSSSLIISITDKTKELKEKYNPILKKYEISPSSAYFESFKQGKLTEELKLYFALNSLDFNNLEIEEDYNLISESKIKEAYEKLFTTAFEAKTFDFNGNSIRYFSKLNSFVSNFLLKKATDNVSLEISEIKEENEKVTIKTTDNLILVFENTKLVSISLQ